MRVTVLLLLVTAICAVLGKKDGDINKGKKVGIKEERNDDWKEFKNKFKKKFKDDGVDEQKRL